MSDDERLGMLLPRDVSPLEAAGWGVVIHYEDDGHVDDSDAASIDYAALLAEMREQAAATSPEREEQGYGTLQVVGWAAPPRYDAAAKKLFWAKELRFSEGSENTLHYDIRVLGRSGVLKALVALLLAGKKLVIPAVIAVGAGLKRVFAGKATA